MLLQELDVYVRTRHKRKGLTNARALPLFAQLPVMSNRCAIGGACEREKCQPRQASGPPEKGAAAEFGAGGGDSNINNMFLCREWESSGLFLRDAATEATQLALLRGLVSLG